MKVIKSIKKKQKNKIKKKTKKGGSYLGKMGKSAVAIAGTLKNSLLSQGDRVLGSWIEFQTFGTYLMKDKFLRFVDKNPISEDYMSNFKYLLKNKDIVFTPQRTRKFIKVNWTNLEKKLSELDNLTIENLLPILSTVGLFGATTFGISGSASSAASAGVISGTMMLLNAVESILGSSGYTSIGSTEEIVLRFTQMKEKNEIHLVKKAIGEWYIKPWILYNGVKKNIGESVNIWINGDREGKLVGIFRYPGVLGPWGTAIEITYENNSKEIVFCFSPFNYLNK